MSSVDLKILALTAVTIGAFTLVANIIPQVESDVPEQIVLDDDITSEELVEIGRDLYEGPGGCVACHSETPGARGPNLLTDHQGQGLIGERCADRIEGMDCQEFLHLALVQPTEYLVEGYEPIMPPADRALDPEQVWAIVAYLQSVGGEVTVTADVILEAADAPDTPAGDDAEPDVAATDPETVVQQLCLQCHVLGDEGTEMGPAFDGIGARLSSDEIRRKILDPDAFISEGYEDFAGVMPGNFGQQLTAGQLEAMVQYLSGLE